MTTPERIALAEMIAKHAHKGQKDSQGQPYYQHPIAIAKRVRTEDEKIVALLHGVLEHSDILITTIRNLFGSVIADAVRAASRMEGESFEAYLRRIKKNPLATTVKLTDFEYAIAVARLPGASQGAIRKAQQYKDARDYLLGHKV